MNYVVWNVFQANSDRFPICLQHFVRRKQTVGLKTHKRAHVRVKDFRICHVWKMRKEHLQPRYGRNISYFEKTEHVSRSNEVFQLLQRYDLFFFLNRCAKLYWKVRIVYKSTCRLSNKKSIGLCFDSTPVIFPHYIST